MVWSSVAVEEFYNKVHNKADGRFSTSGTGGGHYKGRAEGAKRPGDVSKPPAPSGRGGSLSAKRSRNVEDAIKAVGEGKKVVLSTQRQAATLVGKLGKIANDAAAKGTKAKNYDLCNVSVPGTNLFCGVHKGIGRIDMPQFSGKPAPGSAADKMPKNKDGEVDGTKAFEEHMIKQGVGVKMATVKASELKASQNELIGTKIAGMVNNKNFDPAGEAIFVSRDGYVIDGHHRWAAQIARDLKDGHVGDLPLRVRVVDMDIHQVLKEANKWATEFGIKAKAAG